MRHKIDIAGLLDFHSGARKMTFENHTTGVSGHALSMENKHLQHNIIAPTEQI